MGHSDDLEEFDAELELSLKREYSDVFSLFTYCVVTHEATYLCNRLHVEVAPTPGYTLYDIRMEDVWVWDRNRPRRIIPKAQVFTTSDITIEQLKDDPAANLDEMLPNDVAQRLRDIVADDDDDTADETVDDAAATEDE